MIVTTTDALEGHKILKYHGLAAGQAILGIKVFQGFEMIGAAMNGRYPPYEKILWDAQSAALAGAQQRAEAMGANGIVGLRIDVETLGEGGVIIVSALGTAVTVA